MEWFRETLSDDTRDYLAVALVAAGGLYVFVKISARVVGWISAKRMLGRWKNTPKDVVVFHRIPPAIAAPNASPFVLKLETYLRMANIPHEVDLGDGMGPKGKTPWISLNGQHISDSQLCIEFLAKKFEKQIGNYTDEQRAPGTLARVVLDEHFYWGWLMWRYVHSWSKGFGPDKVMPLPILKVMKPIIKWWMRSACWTQGIGRHTEEEIVKITGDDLRAVSKILGNKKFILGDEPSEDDCAIFGQVAQALWCMPGSPYEKLLNTELSNLKQYCLRMKELYWKDWDSCLAK